MSHGVHRQALAFYSRCQSPGIGAAACRISPRDGQQFIEEEQMTKQNCNSSMFTSPQNGRVAEMIAEVRSQASRAEVAARVQGVIQDRG